MRRWPLFVALALAFATGAPILIGAGVDVPDDALYYELASWEWLRFAWLEGRSPWFVGGKLGGVSLFVDTVPMGPFYPAVGLLALMPAGAALPIATLLHALGTLLAVRWFARVLGASPAAASLAGAAVAVGPVGTFGFVDARGVAWATLLWLPVAMAAFERARCDAAKRRRWLALCAAALALLVLGSHVRLSAGALAIFGLWALSSGRGVLWAIPPLLLGLAAGAPGFVPLLAEWRQASASAGVVGKLAALAGPAESGMTLASVPGLLAPRPWPSYADYSIGVVLGLALVLTLARGPLRLREPAGRAATLALLLLAAALSPAIGPTRWLFAPLLLLTHPVDDVYSALAMIPAAAAAAVGFDTLCRRDVGPWRLRAALCVALAGSGAGLLIWGDHLFRDDAAIQLYRLALLQVAVAVPLALLLFRGRRGNALIGLGLLELGLVALRLHTAVPGDPLPLLSRTDVPGVHQLADGYLDVDDLARLEPFRYDRAPAERGPEPPEFWEDTAETMQAEILHRRWPAHLGMARGYRGLSGRAKLIPQRQVAVLTPLADQLRGQNIDGEHLRALFEDRGGIGARTLSLHGIAVAAAPDGVVLTVPDLAPPCYRVTGVRYVADPRERIDAVLQPGFSVEHADALIEDSALIGRGRSVPEVRCLRGGAEVSSAGESMVVFRERHHPGWVVRSGSTRLPTVPINVVHTGVIVPPGEHRLSLSFEPPGLARSLWVAALGWALILGLAVVRPTR